MEEQTRIKICGLTRLEDIDAVNELKPEYVGILSLQKPQTDYKRTCR